MNLTTIEKEKALKDLHEIPDTLHSIGRAAYQLEKINVKLERIADALETIATEMAREREVVEDQSSGGSISGAELCDECAKICMDAEG